MSIAKTDQDTAAAHGKIIARAWRDPAFKAKLLADPHGALKDAGVAVPAGVTVKVVENSDSLFHLVLPPKPTDELSDEALDKVAGGLIGAWMNGGWVLPMGAFGSLNKFSHLQAGRSLEF